MSYLRHLTFAAGVCLLRVASAGAETPPPPVPPVGNSIIDDHVVTFQDDFTRDDTVPPANIGSEWSDGSTRWAIVKSSPTWKIQSHTLVPTVTGEHHATSGPIRPSGEDCLNQGAELTTGPLPAAETIADIPYDLLLRVVPGSPTGSNYTFELKLNPAARTGTVVMADGTGGGPFDPVTGPVFPILTGHSYVLTATARTLYAGGFTILAYTVADAETPSIFLDTGQSALVPMHLASLARAGAVGLQQERGDLTRSDLDVVTRFRSFSEPIHGINTVASPLPASTAGNVVTISGTGTAWTPGAPGSPIFALSDLPDCAIVSQQILSPTLARVTITTGATSGTLRLIDPASGTACTLSVAKTSSPLIVTNLIPEMAPPTTVIIIGGVVTGGRPPYTYQWYRSANWSFTPDDSTKLPGATHLDLLDTPPDDECYAYKLVVTDSTPGAALTAVSPAAPGMRNWRPVPNPVFRPTSSHIPPLNIGWIGDSVTGTGTLNVATTLSYLRAAGVTAGSSTNRGKGGSYTGLTGNNGWYPGAPSGLYSGAISAFQAAQVNVIMLQLGTNDAQAYGVGKAAYMANLNAILARLAQDLPGVPVILNTPALATKAAGRDPNDTQIAFVEALDEVAAANPNAVRGDRNMPVWSYGRYGEYADEIHPNALGSDSFARYWADALLRYEQSAHP